jgi:hypothetical protein
MANAYGGGRSPDGHNPEVARLPEKHLPHEGEPTGVSLRQEPSIFRPSPHTLIPRDDKPRGIQQPLYQIVLIESVSEHQV